MFIAPGKRTPESSKRLLSFGDRGFGEDIGELHQRTARGGVAVDLHNWSSRVDAVSNQCGVFGDAIHRRDGQRFLDQAVGKSRAGRVPVDYRVDGFFMKSHRRG